MYLAARRAIVSVSLPANSHRRTWWAGSLTEPAHLSCSVPMSGREARKSGGTPMRQTTALIDELVRQSTTLADRSTALEDHPALVSYPAFRQHLGNVATEYVAEIFAAEYSVRQAAFAYRTESSMHLGKARQILGEVNHLLAIIDRPEVASDIARLQKLLGEVRALLLALTMALRGDSGALNWRSA